MFEGTMENLVRSFAVMATPGYLLPEPLSTISLSWAFVIGALVGSFLNVVIARVPQGKSVVRPRSQCMKCQSLVRWFDNIPMISWIVLKGRCRTCGVSISFRYFLIEFIVGLFALGIAYRYGLNLLGLERFCFAILLIAIAFVDIDTWTIPYELVLPGAVFGLGFALVGFWANTIGATVVPLTANLEEALISRILGGVFGFLGLNAFRVLSTVYLRKRGRLAEDQEAMGLGDPLLLGMMGMFLGWPVLPLILFLGAVQGTFAGLILKLAGKLKAPQVAVETADDAWTPPSDSIQFGPFLALAGLEVAFLGITWIPFFSRLY
jgi:leader peptidase (prepilin peptidase) / N-methyltransferase